MKLKQLQQKINELVEQGHGDAIVCSYWLDTGRYEESYRVLVQYDTVYQSSVDDEHYTGKIFELC